MIKLFTTYIQKMGIINPGWTGRCTGQTAKTAVNMVTGIFRCSFRAFQHLTQHPDSATRAIAFITGDHKGRTGRRAKPAMHTFPQNGVTFTDKRVCKLGFGKMGLHLILS
jgi:hypothetical protein